MTVSKVVNLWCSIDKLRQGLQHFWIRVGGVIGYVVLVLPQTDRNRLRTAGVAQGDPVLETLLFAKQRPQ